MGRAFWALPHYSPGLLGGMGGGWHDLFSNYCVRSSTIPFLEAPRHSTACPQEEGICCTPPFPPVGEKEKDGAIQYF